ncbi:MAG: hypothetical protein PHC51_07030 [bacterium]|nr:hypothetical protein [bacterium]
MELKRSIYWKLFLSAFTILIISLGTMGLFLRMTPAIETILQDNVPSIMATHGMFRALSMRHSDRETEKENFISALQLARDAAHNDNEFALVSRVKALGEKVFAGEEDYLPSLTAALKELADVNHHAMIKRDNEARRLGNAGAWAVMMMGFFGFSGALFAMSRIRQHVLEPIDDTYNALVAFERGETRRRAHLTRSAPFEIAEIIRSANHLMDEIMAASIRRTQKGIGPDYLGVARLLFERLPEPAILLGAKGEVLLSNHAGLEFLLAENGESLRKHLRHVVESEEGDVVPEFTKDAAIGQRVETVLRVPDTSLRVVLLKKPELV